MAKEAKKKVQEKEEVVESKEEEAAAPEMPELSAKMPLTLAAVYFSRKVCSAAPFVHPMNVSILPYILFLSS